MSIKKTISLQEDVFIVAARNAKVMCNGNLSNYINSLIYNANKAKIDELQKYKPTKCGNIFNAKKKTQCEYCGQYMYVGDKICYATYADGHESCTHIDCCK